MKKVVYATKELEGTLREGIYYGQYNTYMMLKGVLNLELFFVDKDIIRENYSASP